MTTRIGIVGYGMVGKAVENGFKAPTIISDPARNSISVELLCSAEPAAIFVCVPTPTDGTEFQLLKDVLQKIKVSGYKGLTVVKSTVLPQHLEGFDVVYNPEFLSRATANGDFINPPLLLIGGKRGMELVNLYREYSHVCLDRVVLTDIKTAALAKYAMNSFYATKITFMNGIYDVAQAMGVDYNKVAEILVEHPWMGTHHFMVPGPDGNRGFGGPCLPKDTEALAKTYNLELLNKVLELNEKYRK